MGKCYFYRSDSNTVTQFDDGIANQCASGVGCCNVGTYCLEGGICQVPGPIAPGYTGYFMGSCSDPTFSDPSCPKQCTSLPNPDVAYNSTSGEWACCGVDADGKVNCDHPTIQDFSAPAPSDLSTIGFVPTTATVASSSTSSSTSSSSHTSTRTTNSASTSSTQTGTSSSSSSQTPTATQSVAAVTSSSSGVTTGAAVGIALGVALGVVALCAIAAYIFFRRRRSARQQQQQQQQPQYHQTTGDKMVYAPGMASTSNYYNPPQYNQPQFVHEISGDQGPRHEKSATGNATRVELEARH